MHEESYADLLQQFDKSLKSLEKALRTIEEAANNADSLEERAREVLEATGETNRHLEKLLALASPSPQAENEAGREEEITPPQLQRLAKTIEEKDEKISSQLFYLSEQQIRLLSEQEKLKRQLWQQAKSSIKWRSVLGTGIFVVLTLCLALLHQKPGFVSFVNLADEGFSGAQEDGSPPPAGGAAAEMRRPEASLPPPAAGAGNTRQDAVRSKQAGEENDGQGAAAAEKPAASPETPGSLTKKGVPEETGPAPQLLPPEKARKQIAPRDEYALTYLKEKNFGRLAQKYIHPEKGVHLLPFGLAVPGKVFSPDNDKGGFFQPGAVPLGERREHDSGNELPNVLQQLHFRRRLHQGGGKALQ
ncbi:MAG: hypothetical protein J5I98_20095 [Phaeodactylibacter sp.]|nr:hypothetical protein [Phaeodactylibacter sp.]